MSTEWLSGVGGSSDRERLSDSEEADAAGVGGGAEDRRSRSAAEPPTPAAGNDSLRPLLSGARPRPGSAMARLPSTETNFTPEQRLLILDTWRRSGLPAGDFAPLVGVSKHTLYAWKKQLRRRGPGRADGQAQGGAAPVRACPS